MTAKADKVDYVKAQRVTGSHTCHWTGCTKQVAPAMWGCKEHWFRLPRTIRNLIWKTFEPGQEIEKTPSPEYLAAVDLAQKFIATAQEPTT